MLQLTHHVRDVGKAHIHWNTGSWNVPEPKEYIWMDIFGDAHPQLEALTDEPGKVVLMSWRSLQGSRPAVSAYQTSIDNSSSSSGG